MLTRTLVMILLVTAGLGLVLQQASAETVVQDVVIYQTSFTTDPQWITNSPRSYYWVPEKGVYHYAIQPSSGAYAYVAVQYTEGPFTLEYDLTPQSTEENSAFRLGFCTDEMLRTKGTIALTEFTNGKNGRLMWIRAVTPSNKLFEVNSYSFSYAEKSGGRTVNFVDNKTYHVSLQYDNVRNTLTMRVQEKNTGAEIWGYFLSTNEELRNMNRIAIGPLGDFSSMVPIAEGYIDNVRLTVQKSVTISPTEATTVPTTAAPPRTTIKPTTRPTTAAPTEEPTSPVSPVTVLAALGIIGAAAISGTIRQKR